MKRGHGVTKKKDSNLGNLALIPPVYRLSISPLLSDPQRSCHLWLSLALSRYSGVASQHMGQKENQSGRAST